MSHLSVRDDMNDGVCRCYEQGSEERLATGSYEL